MGAQVEKREEYMKSWCSQRGSGCRIREEGPDRAREEKEGRVRSLTHVRAPAAGTTSAIRGQSFTLVGSLRGTPRHHLQSLQPRFWRGQTLGIVLHLSLDEAVSCL